MASLLKVRGCLIEVSSERTTPEISLAFNLLFPVAGQTESDFSAIETATDKHFGDNGHIAYICKMGVLTEVRMCLDKKLEVCSFDLKQYRKRSLLIRRSFFASAIVHQVP